MFLCALAIATLAAAPTWAQQPTADEVNAVAGKLSCPTCTGINVADCPTETCAQWRAKIADMLAQGQTEQQILDFFAARYGDEVLQIPPKRGIFLWVWLVPALFVVAGLSLLVAVIRARTRRAAVVPADVKDDYEGDAYTRRVEEDLKRWW